MRCWRNCVLSPRTLERGVESTGFPYVLTCQTSPFRTALAGLMAQIRDLMCEAQTTDDGQRPTAGNTTAQPPPRNQSSIPMTPGSSGDSARGPSSGGNATTTTTAGGHAPGAGLGPTANGSSVSSSLRMRRRSTGQQSASAVSLSASSSYAGGLDGLELDRELELQVSRTYSMSRHL